MCYFSKCVPCFHLFQSFSVIDDSNPASPSSDISGLVAEPNLSGRSHTLIFSSSEVSALLVAQSQKLCGTPWCDWKGTFSSMLFEPSPFIVEIKLWMEREHKRAACVCWSHLFCGLPFLQSAGMFMFSSVQMFFFFVFFYRLLCSLCVLCFSCCFVF